jgi:hypothetical protein
VVEKTITKEHTDPIYLAIEKHPMADAAYGDELDRSADESVKESRQKREGAALITSLRTKQSCSAVGTV